MKKTKILVAPTSYKGSLSAKEVAQAIQFGLESTGEQIDIKCMPLADGGDGTMDTIRTCLGGKFNAVNVLGPLDNNVISGWLALDNWILVELANCCGLATITNKTFQPLLAHTYGLGQLIGACLSSPHKKILIGLGGSASTDGGTGALAALGVKFLDIKQKQLPLGGGFLSNLLSINLSSLDERLENKEIELLTDVRSPLLGKEGSAMAFASQKGANLQEIELLECGLTKLAQIILKTTKIDLKELPGTGSAGGTAFGLASLLKAKISPGFSKIAEIVGLEEEIKSSDLIISAEGKLDFQSFNGKVIGELAKLCRTFSKPLIVFPALVEDEFLWQEFGISAVYKTSTEEHYVSSVDIIKTVKNKMKGCKHF